MEGRNNFEILLEMACKRCAEEDCALFMHLDSADREIIERERQSIKNIIEEACFKGDQ